MLTRQLQNPPMSRMPAANTGFASGGVVCCNQALGFYYTFVLAERVGLLNPPERKAR